MKIAGNSPVEAARNPICMDAHQTRLAALPEALTIGELAGRQVLVQEPDQGPLLPEINALISSFIAPEHARAFGVAANWKFDRIYPMVLPAVRTEARALSELERREEGITPQVLGELERDFPALVTLDIRGSTWNGSRDFGIHDIRAAHPNFFPLYITGVPTLAERVQFLEGEIHMREASLYELEAARMSYTHTLAVLTARLESAQITETQPAAPNLPHELQELETQIVVLQEELQGLQTRLACRKLEQIIDIGNRTIEIIVTNIKSG